jgi:lincosamide nucleotidyltransferase A/C/D/E
VAAMSAEQALDVYQLLDGGGVRPWVMGGWGVDALLGRVTRSHKDLDLLVHVDDLARYDLTTRETGFRRRLEWSENLRFVRDGAEHDAAFVDAHPDGREIDVHVVDVRGEGSATQLHRDPWPLPSDALSGQGMLAGKRVRCVSRAAQLAMHSGYELPEAHREDVRLLRASTT